MMNLEQVVLAAILVFSMGSDIFSVSWLEFITFANSMIEWSSEIGLWQTDVKKADLAIICVALTGMNGRMLMPCQQF
jgi:hypothetical protein